MCPNDLKRWCCHGVADGMGQAAGEVASRLAITLMVHLVLETPTDLQPTRAASAKADRARSGSSSRSTRHWWLLRGRIRGYSKWGRR
jgi:serine/threonine protein phosphatase PrpC